MCEKWVNQGLSRLSQRGCLVDFLFENLQIVSK